MTPQMFLGITSENKDKNTFLSTSVLIRNHKAFCTLTQLLLYLSFLLCFSYCILVIHYAFNNLK